MALLLRNLGHEVDVVHDGAAALKSVQATKPDVVLLDIGLPVLNGYEVAERLRQQPEFEDTHLFAVTGYGQPADCERSKLAGFDHHFVKPVNLAKLQELLGQVTHRVKK
jgi:two-component system CheB/CheR fusion protein